MNVVFVLVVLYGTAWWLAYQRATLEAWLLIFGIANLVAWLGVDGLLSGALFLLGFAGWLAVLAAMVPNLRKQWFVAPALSHVSGRARALGMTLTRERRAGSAWLESDVLSGVPDFRRLIQMPAGSLSEAEQALVDGPVATLAGMLEAWERSGDHDVVPEDVATFASRHGLFALSIPHRYEGLGVCATAQVAVIEALSEGSPRGAVQLLGPETLGVAEIILESGSEAQRARWLPAIGRGEVIPALARAISDPGVEAVADDARGRVVAAEDGQGLEVEIDIPDMQVGLCGQATLILVPLMLSDPDNLLQGPGAAGTTLMLLPAATPGVTLKADQPKASADPASGRLAVRGLRLPMRMVINEQAGCGHGAMQLQNGVAAGRQGLSVLASSAAAARTLLERASVFSRLATINHIPLARTPAAQEALARAARDVYVMDSMSRVLSGAVDVGEKPAVSSTLATMLAADRLSAVARTDAVLTSGRGPLDAHLGLDYGRWVQRALAATMPGRPAAVLEGGTLLFRQGLVLTHPWLSEAIAAGRMEGASQRLDAFAPVFGGYMRHIGQVKARALFKNITLGLIGDDPSVGIANYWFGQLTRASTNLSLLVDVALLFGDEDEARVELRNRHFAETLATLLALAMVLKRFEDDGRPNEDEALLELCLRDGMVTVNSGLRAIVSELPSRLLRFGMATIVFPLGDRSRPGTDAQQLEVEKLVTRPSNTRKRLLARRGTSDSALERNDLLALAVETEAAWLRLNTLSEVAPEARLEVAVEEGLLTHQEAERVRIRMARLAGFVR